VIADTQTIGEASGGLSRVERFWTKVIGFLDEGIENPDDGRVILGLLAGPKTLCLRR
jgi:hypothetical protein